jgi:hypothetical protein
MVKTQASSVMRALASSSLNAPLAGLNLRRNSHHVTPPLSYMFDFIANTLKAEQPGLYTTESAWRAKICTKKVCGTPLPTGRDGKVMIVTFAIFSRYGAHRRGQRRFRFGRDGGIWPRRSHASFHLRPCRDKTSEGFRSHNRLAASELLQAVTCHLDMTSDFLCSGCIACASRTARRCRSASVLLTAIVIPRR